jgi:hypothetical protein
VSVGQQIDDLSQHLLARLQQGMAIWVEEASDAGCGCEMGNEASATTPLSRRVEKPGPDVLLEIRQPEKTSDVTN